MARAPYGLVAALMLVGFADEWFTFLPAGVLEPLRHDAGLTYAEGGLVLAALSLGGVIGVAFEVAADYVSRRLLASAGAAAYGGAMIAFGLADSFWLLFAAAFVWGAASDAFVHGCEVALVDLAGDDLPRALARVNAWSAVGDLLAPLTLAGAALVGLDWRWVFLGGGGLMLAYAAWLAAYRFPPPQPSEEHARPLAGVWAVVTDGRVLLLAVVMGLYALLDEPLLAFLIAYLQANGGYGPAAAVTLGVGMLLGGLVGFALAERLVPATKPAKALAPAAVALTMAAPVMIFGPTAWLVLAGGLGCGVAGAVFYTALQSVILTLRPGQAGATGAVVSAVGLAGAGFPGLVGWVADTWGLAAGMGLYAAIPAVVLALLLPLRRL